MRAGLRHATILALLLAAGAAGPSVLAQGTRRWVDPPPDLGRAAPPNQAPPAAQTPPAGAAVSEDAAQPDAPRAAQPRPAPVAPGPAVRSAQPDRAPSPAEDARASARPATPPAAAPPVQSAQPQRPAAAPQEARPSAGAERARGSLEPQAAESRLAAREDAARDLLIDYLDLWSTPNPLALAGSTGFYAPSVIFHGRSMSARALMEEKRRFVQRWPERRYRARPDTVGVACGPGGETCTVRSVFDFTAVDPERGRRSHGVATLELVVAFGDDGRPVILAEDSLVHGRGRASASPGSGEADDVP